MRRSVFVIIFLVLAVSAFGQWGRAKGGAVTPTVENPVYPETYPSWKSVGAKSGTIPYCPPTSLDAGEAFSALRCTGLGVIRVLEMEIESDEPTWEYLLDSIWVSIREGEGCRYAGTPLVTGTVTPIDSFPLSVFVLAPADPSEYDRYDGIYTSITQDMTLGGTRYRSYRTNLWIPFREGFTFWVTNHSSQNIVITASIIPDYYEGALPDFGAMNYFHIDYVTHDFASQALRNELVPLTTISGMGKGVFFASCFYGTMSQSAQENRFLGFFDRDIPIAICSSWVNTYASANDTCYVYAGGFDDWEFDYPQPYIEKRLSPFLLITDQSAGDSSEYCWLPYDRREDYVQKISGWHGDENYFALRARANHQAGDTIYAVPDADITNVSMNHMIPDAGSNSSLFSSSIYGNAKVRGYVGVGVQGWVKLWNNAVFDSVFNFYALSSSASVSAFTGRYALWSWTERSNAVTVIDSNRAIALADSVQLPLLDSIKCLLMAKWATGHCTGQRPVGDYTSPCLNLVSPVTAGFGCDARYDSVDYYMSNGKLNYLNGGNTSSWQGTGGADWPRLELNGNDQIYIPSDDEHDRILRNTFGSGNYAFMYCFRSKDVELHGAILVNRGSSDAGRLDVSSRDNWCRWLINGVSTWRAYNCVFTQDSVWHTATVNYNATTEILQIWWDGVKQGEFTDAEANNANDGNIQFTAGAGRYISFKNFALWDAWLSPAHIVTADSLMRLVN